MSPAPAPLWPPPTQRQVKVFAGASRWMLALGTLAFFACLLSVVWTVSSALDALVERSSFSAGASSVYLDAGSYIVAVDDPDCDSAADRPGPSESLQQGPFRLSASGAASLVALCGLPVGDTESVMVLNLPHTGSYTLTASSEFVLSNRVEEAAGQVAVPFMTLACLTLVSAGCLVASVLTAPRRLLG